MSSAGQQLIAGRIPGERIETETITADSAGFTTEAEIASITADLVIGRTYRITAEVGIDITATGVLRLTLREDSVAGTRLQLREKEVSITANVCPYHLEAEFTAVSTASKTFSLAGTVNSGGGTGSINAAADFPSYMYVDYIEG